MRPAGQLLVDAGLGEREHDDLVLAVTVALWFGSVITYCGAGIASTLDAFAQALLGHDDVAVYGMAKWQAEGRPVSDRPEVYPATVFDASEQPDRLQACS